MGILRLTLAVALLVSATAACVTVNGPVGDAAPAGAQPGGAEPLPIAGDAGKGAAIGAASGALIGGMRRRDHARRQYQAEQQWAQEQAAQYTQRRNTYNRAYGACLAGRESTDR